MGKNNTAPLGHSVDVFQLKYTLFVCIYLGKLQRTWNSPVGLVFEKRKAVGDKQGAGLFRGLLQTQLLLFTLELFTAALQEPGSGSCPRHGEEGVSRGMGWSPWEPG